MTQDEIIGMAKQAGVPTGKRFEGERLVECLTFEVQTFAKLVADVATSKEREACAYLCETEWSTDSEHRAGIMFAEAIRARGQHDIA